MEHIETKKIILEGKDRAEVFHFQPEHIDREERGTLFFIGQTRAEARKNDETFYLLNALAATLKREYYTPSNPVQEQAFEEALKKANLNLAQFQTKEIKEKVALCALVLQKHHINFSVIGGINVLLIRQGQLFYLYHQRPQKKLSFGTIIKGRLNDGDKLIVATSKITPLLEDQAFTSRLIKRSFSRLEDYLKNQNLVTKRDEQGLAMLYIGIGNIPRETALARQPALQNRISTQADSQTAEKREEDNKKNSQLTLPLGQTKPTVSLLVLLRSTKNILMRAKKLKPGNIKSDSNKIIRRLASGVKRLKGKHLWKKERHKNTTTTTDYQGKKPKIIRTQYRSNLAKLAPYIQGNWKKMPITLALVAVVGVSAIILLQKPSTTEIVQNQPASALLGVPEQQLILSLQDQELPMQNGYLTNKQALVFNNQTGFDINLRTKNIEPFISVSLPKTLGAKDDVVSAFVVLEGTNSHLYLYEERTKGTQKSALVLPPGREHTIVDIDFFGGNTYILDKANTQIIRYTDGDYVHPVEWLPENESRTLSNPTSFAIDGSIYVLTPPQKIIEYRRGQKVRELELHESVSNQTQLKTNTSLANLYVFDPESNTVLTIDKKTGKIVKERTFSSLQSIFDIYPSEEQNTLLLLNAQGVFESSL